AGDNASLPTSVREYEQRKDAYPVQWCGPKQNINGIKAPAGIPESRGKEIIRTGATNPGDRKHDDGVDRLKGRHPERWEEGERRYKRTGQPDACVRDCFRDATDRRSYIVRL